MFILHLTPDIYLIEHQTSQLLLTFLLTFSDRPPKESPAPVISLMGVALDDSSVIIEAIDASILDFLVRSSYIVVKFLVLNLWGGHWASRFEGFWRSWRGDLYASLWIHTTSLPLQVQPVEIAAEDSYIIPVSSQSWHKTPIFPLPLHSWQWPIGSPDSDSLFLSDFLSGEIS